MADRLIARSQLARTVAQHVLRYGTQTPALPPGCDEAQYRRALERLRKAEVLQRWSWEVDGTPFTPRAPLAGWLYLPGPRWHEFEDEAEAAGLQVRRLRPLDEAEQT